MITFNAMLFAYNEDGTLEVLADEAEARRQFQAQDVESGTIRLFDASGNPLAANFPQRSERKFLGVRISSHPGPFHLAPSSAPDAETLADAFGPTVVLMPNKWFANLDAVRAHLGLARSA